MRGFFAQFVDEVYGVDRAVAERAVELRSQTLSLKMPDALILATADIHADLVLTGDAHWPGVAIA